MVVYSVVSFNSNSGGYMSLICVQKCLLFKLMKSSIYLKVKLNYKINGNAVLTTYSISGDHAKYNVFMV